MHISLYTFKTNSPELELFLIWICLIRKMEVGVLSFICYDCVLDDWVVFLAGWVEFGSRQGVSYIGKETVSRTD